MTSRSIWSRRGWRDGLAGVLVLLALWLLVAPPRPLVGTPGYLAVWGAVNGALGAALGRWWALLLAGLPLVTTPLILWYRLYTGQIAFIGDGVHVFLALMTLTALIGLALGALLGWRHTAR